MNIKKYTIGKFRWLIFSLLFTVGACSEDLPGPLDTSDKITVLESIKIINAGISGDVVIEGVVNENTKEISFPRIVPETDFSNLRFEIQASNGAILDQENYAIDFAEGQSEKTIVLKLVNSPRFREYYAKIRLKIPVFGAEFSKPTVYDFSANEAGNPVYEAFSGLATRGSGFDGEKVLIISRGETGVHLLNVSDLKNNVINRIPINTTGVSGGTFPYNTGAQINGHSYIVSLSTSGASPLKIYHWTDPTKNFEEVYSVLPSTLPEGAGLRHGDNVSFNIDENGNGFIFFISLQGPILRLSVENYTQVSNPTVLGASVSYGQWSSLLRVGNTDDYLLTGNLQPISIVSSSASPAYTMGSSSIAKQGNDARVIEFNGERYLITVTVARYAGETTTLNVYNITNGNTVTEALSNLDAGNNSPVYQYTISSAPNAAPSSQTGWSIILDEDGNDSILQLYVAAADAGFAIIEIPKKIAED